MKIEIDDKFFIKSDVNAFNLYIKVQHTKEVQERSDKTDDYRMIGSYGTLKAAIFGYIKNEQRNDNVTVQLKDIMKYIDNQTERIEKLFS